MKYILIIGNGYRDCKAKFDGLTKEPETKYPFVTKVKHLIALANNEYIVTDVAKENPNFDDIIKVITDAKSVVVEVVKPVVPVEVPVEEEKSNYKEERDKRWDEIVEELKANEPEEITDLEEEIEPEPEIVEPEIMEEVVDEEPVAEEVIEPEVEIEPEPEIVEPEVVEEEVIVVKPVNRPRGWQARKQFIDEIGNIFEKGKFVGNENE